MVSIPTPLIELKSLRRTIPESSRRLIDDVSLVINPGDRIGLSGTSGSGKSTLLRSIARLDPIDGGDVLFRGEVLLADSIPAFRRKVIYLHQRPALSEGTVRENLQFPFQLESSQESYSETRINAWIEALSRPRSILDQPVDSLSGGEQQLVALLRAIQLDPTVILLDEPTASLDGESATKFEHLVNLWFEGSASPALVWVSHDAAQLERMTTRTVVVAEGKIQ